MKIPREIEILYAEKGLDAVYSLIRDAALEGAARLTKPMNGEAWTTQECEAGQRIEVRIRKMKATT